MNLDGDVARRSISLLHFTPHVQERSRALQARCALGQAGMPKSIDPTLVTVARPINEPENDAWIFHNRQTVDRELIHFAQHPGESGHASYVRGASKRPACECEICLGS